MKPAILLALSLASCTTLSATDCARLNTAAATAEQIAAVLVARGENPARAAKIAAAVKAGEMLISAACARAGHPTP